MWATVGRVRHCSGDLHGKGYFVTRYCLKSPFVLCYLLPIVQERSQSVCSELVLVPADWLESGVRLAPVPALLYLAADPPDLETHFLFLSVLPCCHRLNGLGLRKDWVWPKNLFPCFGLLSSLEFDVLWLALNLLMKLVCEQMRICGYALTQCPFPQFGQELRKAALSPDIKPGHCIS